MGVEDMKQSWQGLTPAARMKGAIACVVLVAAVAWIAYLVWPEGPVKVEMAPETQAAVTAFNADRDALRAMTMEQLTQEVKKREAAFQKASKGGTAADFETAIVAFEHAKEVLQQRKSAGGS